MRSYASLRSDSTPHSSLNIVVCSRDKVLLRSYPPLRFAHRRILDFEGPYQGPPSSTPTSYFGGRSEDSPSTWAFGPWGLLRRPIIPKLGLRPRLSHRNKSRFDKLTIDFFYCCSKSVVAYPPPPIQCPFLVPRKVHSEGRRRICSLLLHLPPPSLLHVPRSSERSVGRLEEGSVGYGGFAPGPSGLPLASPGPSGGFFLLKLGEPYFKGISRRFIEKMRKFPKRKDCQYFSLKCYFA